MFFQCGLYRDFICLDQKVKMIGHQAPRKNITNRGYMLSDFFNKKQVIIISKKYGFVGTIVYVVNIVLIEVHICKDKYFSN